MHTTHTKPEISAQKSTCVYEHIENSLSIPALYSQDKIHQPTDTPANL